MDNHEWRLAEIDKKLDQLLAFQSTVSGGYKMLLSVGAIAGTIASLITAAVLKLKSGI